MQTRKITEGAMLSAIIGVLLFLDRQSAGMFNYMLYWIVPVPIIVYIAKYTVKDAFMPIFTIAVLAFALGTPASVYYVLMGSLIAIWYGDGLKRGKESNVLLIRSCLISIASSFLTMFVFASVFGYDINEDMVLMQETLQSMSSYFPAQNLETLLTLVPALVIASMIFSGVLEGILIHMISSVVLNRLKFKVKPMKSLFELRLPRIAGILGAVLMFASAYFSMTSDDVVLANMCIFVYLSMALLFLANGYLSILTILAYYNKRKFILLAILFFPLLILIGIYDSIMNLRETLTVRYRPDRMKDHIRK